jgi:hypothetical protein
MSTPRSANDQFIETLKQEYENIFEDGTGKMTVHRGKHLKYLRMDLDFSTPGVCKITMPKYIKDLLKAWELIAPKDKGTKDCAAPKEVSQHCGEDLICHEARQA